ncbi:MAG: glycosyltransferase family 2 protein [Paludibacteraceae bacterium]|nr:glycosyltransferase family 2 protein [Paludibacteraceae bacterium]
MVDVSVIIVCMNKLENLYPCLNSIKECTSVSYEVFVVAYLFTKENLEKARNEFPWVKFIVSDEIRGFAENNNLALRQATGKYCFVLNDDTILKPKCIDILVDSFDKLSPNVAVVSPNILNKDGELVVSGMPPFSFSDYIQYFLRLKPRFTNNQWVMKKGLFKTYNILGCAFLIKRDVFEKFGWFDEYFFFAPEDVALSTSLNNNGYECWVNSDSELIHLEGMTSGKSLSKITLATAPAHCKGLAHFFSKGNALCYIFVALVMTFVVSSQFLFHLIKSFKDTTGVNSTLAKANIHELIALYSFKTPKELFIKYYSKQ